MSQNIDWSDTIKKEAEGLNGEDFGEVQNVSNGQVLTQRGIINKERFLIPQELAESYDGDIVRFRISEDELLNKYREESNADYSTQTNISQDTIQNETSESTTTTVPLTEEQLDVSKKVEEQQATITKEPVTETKTVEVPITHEEISIERRKPTDENQFQEASAKGPVTSTEEINIPLKREEVDVSKKPVVKEEVVVKKKPVTETKEVTEEVTTERLDISDT